VRPGSHRQLFEHGYPQYRSAPDAIVSKLPGLSYRPPVALEGQAGDVLFMHHLLGSTGSASHDDHIRYGLNGSISVDRNKPYRRRIGGPEADETPLDHTLRVDTLPEAAAASTTC
jgi:hypothetical protein